MIRKIIKRSIVDFCGSRTYIISRIIRLWPNDYQLNEFVGDVSWNALFSQVILYEKGDTASGLVWRRLMDAEYLQNVGRRVAKACPRKLLVVKRDSIHKTDKAIAAKKTLRVPESILGTIEPSNAGIDLTMSDPHNERNTIAQLSRAAPRLYR